MITIFGSCRQDAMKDWFPVTSIRDRLTYPHYTKEIIQAIEYCRGDDFPSEFSKICFRSGQITNRELRQRSFRNEFYNTKLFVLEVTSRKEYLYKGRYYLHHEILKYEKLVPEREIQTKKTSSSELALDVGYIKKILSPADIIVIPHISTQEGNSRHELVGELKKICEKENLKFLDPMAYLNKNDLDRLFVEKEPNIAHYTQYGNEVIGEIYVDFIANNTIMKPMRKKNNRLTKKFYSWYGRI